MKMAAQVRDSAPSPRRLIDGQGEIRVGVAVARSRSPPGRCTFLASSRHLLTASRSELANAVAPAISCAAGSPSNAWSGSQNPTKTGHRGNLC